MEYRRITASEIDELWELQKAYKAEIHENSPTDADRERLAEAIREGKIRFYGAWNETLPVGCCSVTMGFSTFNYLPSGVFEDFYITPEYRHKGIARELVRFAHSESKVESLTVGAADCDVKMYEALGFTIHLGNMLAYE